MQELRNRATKLMPVATIYIYHQFLDVIKVNQSSSSRPQGKLGLHSKNACLK